MESKSMFLRFGGLTFGFTGWVPALRADSLLPAFVQSTGAADFVLNIYHDPEVRIPAPLIYEDQFSRVYWKDGRAWMENSAHGTMKTWGYSILHAAWNEPMRLQILSPTSTFQMEHVLSGMMMESRLLANDRLILHASVIRQKNHVILFSAPSGTGKSTQAELWRQYADAEILNGDRVLIRCDGDELLACGLPFAGTSAICKDFSHPIRAIVVLRQGTENRAEAMPPMDALKCLLSQISLQRWNQRDLEAAIRLTERLIAELPIYRFSCLPEKSAVEYLQQVLTEKDT